MTLLDPPPRPSPDLWGLALWLCIAAAPLAAVLALALAGALP